MHYKFPQMSINSILHYFVPKDKKVFFPLFENAAGNVVAMAGNFLDAVNTVNPHAREDIYARINKLEHTGDEITHRIYLELSKTFITPFDREDIAALASAIDDVADYINGSAGRMVLYHIDHITEPIKKLAELVLQAATDMEKAIRELSDMKNIRGIADSCVRINSIENQADKIFDRAVADLFLYERDAIQLIKYKEVLSNLETATDKCEDVANVLETILVKNV